MGTIPVGFTKEEGVPPPPAAPAVRPKVRYDLQVNGSDVSILREGEAISHAFSTIEKDLPQDPANCMNSWRTSAYLVLMRI
jgi:hypothetical protein